MPESLQPCAFVETETDDECDAKIFNPVPVRPVFTPSPATRFNRLQMMPPPIETSTVASKALGKELKNLVRLQEDNVLPFYINPDTDR